MHVTTKRCVIRQFSADDAAQLYHILSDKDVMEYIEPPFTMDQTRAFIETAGLCVPPLVYALEWKETKRLIGQVIFHRYEEDSFEIGWILHREFWGLGIAGEVTSVLVDQAHEIGARSCVIECDARQSASKHIALRHGFLYEGQDDGCDIYRLTF